MLQAMPEELADFLLSPAGRTLLVEADTLLAARADTLTALTRLRRSATPGTGRRRVGNGRPPKARAGQVRPAVGTNVLRARGARAGIGACASPTTTPPG